MAAYAGLAVRQLQMALLRPSKGSGFAHTCAYHNMSHLGAFRAPPVRGSSSHARAARARADSLKLLLVASTPPRDPAKRDIEDLRRGHLKLQLRRLGVEPEGWVLDLWPAQEFVRCGRVVCRPGVAGTKGGWGIEAPTLLRRCEPSGTAPRMRRSRMHSKPRLLATP